jgi:predicted outer membrane repeat protein
VVTDLEPPQINFSPQLNGSVITLQRGELEVSAPDLIVDASSLDEGLTIDADDQSRIWNLRRYGSLHNLVLTGGFNNTFGRYGGAINAVGVSLYNCTVADNFSSERGGAISARSLGLYNSTISSNSTNVRGGAIAMRPGASSTTRGMTIANSTISGNYAALGGGAIYASGSPLSVSLTNSTVANNTAVGQGGGVYLRAATELSMVNSIIAGSQGGADCYLRMVGPQTPAVFSDSASIGEDGSCGDARAVDPKLLPLEDNGGRTKTHALLAGSPAINRGDNQVCQAAPINNKDQRGVARPVGARCDVGAYEGSIDNGSFYTIPLKNGKVLTFSL